MSFKLAKRSIILAFMITPSVSIADFDDSDILTSLGAHQKEVREYLDGGVSLHQCLVSSDNIIEDCGAKNIDINTMIEANGFDVAIYNKDPMSKLVSMEVKSSGQVKYSDYAERTEKVCAKSVTCEYLDPVSKKYVRSDYDIMFVLRGGLDVTRDTISVGYRPATED